MSLFSVFLSSLVVDVLHNFLEFKAENIEGSRIYDKVLTPMLVLKMTYLRLSLTFGYSVKSSKLLEIIQPSSP